MDTNATVPDTSPEEGQPKKYIRTFEGDLATLKKGGVPDLVPFVESREKPAEETSAIPFSVVQKTIIPLVPKPIKKISPPPPIQKIPLPPPPPPPPPKQEPPPSPPEALARPTPIETYASDFSDRIKETHASTVTVLAAEQDAAPHITQATSQDSSRRGRAYVIAGIAMVVVGGVGVYFSYERHLVAVAPVILAPTVPAPIFVDDREQVSGVGSALLQEIEQSVALPVKGTIRLLYIMGATTTDSNIFLALHFPAPDILLRNVNVGGGMAGIVNTGNSQSPFFILSVDSYSDTFAGMLSWESTMPHDLGMLFPPYSSSIVATSSATTTQTMQPTASTTSILSPSQGFRDEVIDNHNVRVYRDAAGRSLFLYGYWNQTTLVIARDTKAFTDILQRLATSHT